MAQDFINYKNSATGATPVVIHTSNSNDSITSIRLCNINASVSINVDCYITNGSNFYLVKTAPIPVGSSLELVDGKAITLIASDALTVVSDTASSLDSIVSVVDAISA